MSERVTWEACPRCGGLAAVGWAPVGSIEGRLRGLELPVEFDCRVGCRPTRKELHQLLDRLLDGLCWRSPSE